MLSNLMDFFYGLVARAKVEEGQAMVEYGLILALVSVAALVALAAIGTNIGSAFSSVSTAITNAL
jgi:pilus assembly protein Flp/PilA